MSTPPASESNAKVSSAGAGTFILCIAVLLAAMAAFWYYPYPSGTRPDLFAFVGFWLRELLILGTVLVVAISLAVSRVLRQVRRPEQRSNAE